MSVSATQLFSLASTVSLTYGATDANSGVGSYDVRYRRAASNTVFGPLAYPAAWQQTTARSVSLAAVKGSTTCMSVRARDRASNASAWSAERCTASPLDDRSLTASAGWTRPASSAYYAGTATSTARTGATLTRTSVQTRKIALVATKCRGCGTVGVYGNGRLIRQISLSSAATVHRQIITVTDLGTVRSGTLVIKTLNTGRVYLDGLALSRV